MCRKPRGDRTVEQKLQIVETVRLKHDGANSPEEPRLKFSVEEYSLLRKRVFERDGWGCQNCGLSTPARKSAQIRQ